MECEMAAGIYRDRLREKRRRRFLLKLFLIIGLVFLCAAGAVYLLFFAGFLDVRTVDISGTEVIPSADLRAVAEKWLGGGILGVSRSKNLLFISSEKLALQLTAEFPRIDSIRIDKEPPHGLRISIVERKSAGIWCFAALDSPSQIFQGKTWEGKCFYFDRNGVAYAEAGQSSGFLILNVADYRGRAIALGSAVASEEWFKNIIAAGELLPKIGVNAAEFSIPSGSFDEFDAKTAQGWKIMFSTSTDVAKQISSLGVLFRDKLPASVRAGLQYVDLRIQDRIYYK
jgi:hypothetical protein